MNRRELILMLRDSEEVILKDEYTFIGGMTFREIGNIFGVSRQRIHQIVSNSRYKGKTGRPQRNPVGSAEL